MSADIVDPAKRSKIMSAIHSRDTQPEMIVRRWLHKNGYRYRLHRKELPGKPDIVLPKWKSVIFVNGCFFHHHGCHLSYTPKTRTEWWEIKFQKNRERDSLAISKLKNLGWDVLIVWECNIRDGSYSVVLQEFFRSGLNNG